MITLLPGTESSNRDFRNFLREGSFGLTDPSRPPSKKNPPLNFHSLSDSGILPRNLIFDLILLYGWYNGLIQDGVLYHDDLMKRYIQPALIEENQDRIGKDFEAVPLDRIVFSHRVGAIQDYVSGHFIPRLGRLEQLDLPISGSSLPDLDMIERQVYNLLSYYERRLAFYRTDGTIFQPQ